MSEPPRLRVIVRAPNNPHVYAIEIKEFFDLTGAAEGIRTPDPRITNASTPHQSHIQPPATGPVGVPQALPNVGMRCRNKSSEPNPRVLEPLIKRRQICLLSQGQFRKRLLFSPPADPRRKTGRVGMKECRARKPNPDGRCQPGSGFRAKAEMRA